MSNRMGARICPGMNTQGRRWCGRAVLFAKTGETAMLRCECCNRLRYPASQQHGGSRTQTDYGNGQQGKRHHIHLQLQTIERSDRSIICCNAANINIPYVVYQ